MKLYKKIFNIALSAGFIGLTVSNLTLVHAADSESVIESRQSKFKEMGGAMKAINEQLKADQIDIEKVQQAANKLNLHALALKDWFPAGSDSESGLDTDALPAIWQETDKFSVSAKNLVDKTSALKQSVEQSDTSQLSAQLKAVKGACSDCHKGFRAD